MEMRAVVAHDQPLWRKCQDQVAIGHGEIQIASVDRLQSGTFQGAPRSRLSIC